MTEQHDPIDPPTSPDINTCTHPDHPAEPIDTTGTKVRRVGDTPEEEEEEFPLPSGALEITYEIRATDEDNAGKAALITVRCVPSDGDAETTVQGFVAWYRAFVASADSVTTMLQEFVASWTSPTDDDTSADTSTTRIDTPPEFHPGFDDPSEQPDFDPTDPNEEIQR